jgi:transcriptional regulator with XRE-family HTH domain
MRQVVTEHIGTAIQTEYRGQMQRYFGDLPVVANELPPFDTFWGRLNKFREPKESDKAFARRLGIARTTLSRWKVKGVFPRTQSLLALMKAFDNNWLIFRWLFNGSYDPAREDLSC